jgi:uncharacterized membrane protein
MTWLGGISLSLAGVFLVVYSIEQGLITPAMRIVLGYLAGLGFWVGAEILRRRLVQPSGVFAALAAGGSITLFAATLAGAHLYDLFSLNTAFAILCVVALTTMWLAISHGPLLAALGIIGALGWWLLSFGVDREVYVRGWYLLGIAYLFAAVPGLDWIVRRDTALNPPTDTVKAYLRSVFTPTNQSNDFDLLLVFILLNGAAAVSIYLESRYQLAILRWLPLLAFTLFFARKREALVLAAWFAVISTFAAWIAIHLHSIDTRLALRPAETQFSALYFQYLAAVAVAVLGIGLWNYSNRRSQQMWAALASLTPVLALITGYLTTAPNPDA